MPAGTVIQTWQSATGGPQLATAWANYDPITGVIRSSYNIAGITQIPTGWGGGPPAGKLQNCVYSITFSNPMQDANYLVVAMKRAYDADAPTVALDYETGGLGVPQTTTGFGLVANSTSGCEWTDTLDFVVYGN